MDKKTNPFKMWGSWVGVVIVLLFFSYKILIELGITIDRIADVFYYNGYIINILIVLSFMSIGFLLGWGIHSLIRRLLK